MARWAAAKGAEAERLAEAGYQAAATVVVVERSEDGPESVVSKVAAAVRAAVPATEVALKVMEVASEVALEATKVALEATQAT